MVKVMLFLLFCFCKIQCTKLNILAKPDAAFQAINEVLVTFSKKKNRGTNFSEICIIFAFSLIYIPLTINNMCILCSFELNNIFIFSVGQ